VPAPQLTRVHGAAAEPVAPDDVAPFLPAAEAVVDEGEARRLVDRDSGQQRADEEVALGTRAQPCAGAEERVEAPERAPHRAPYGHARGDAFHLVLLVDAGREERLVPHVARDEARAAIVRPRQDVAAHDARLRMRGDGERELVEPVARNLAVVVGDRDPLVGRGRDADVASVRDPRRGGADVADTAAVARDEPCDRVRRPIVAALIDDDDVQRRMVRRENRADRSRHRGAALARGDDDGERHRRYRPGKSVVRRGKGAHRGPDRSPILVRGHCRGSACGWRAALQVREDVE